MPELAWFRGAWISRVNREPWSVDRGRFGMPLDSTCLPIKIAK